MRYFAAITLFAGAALLPAQERRSTTSTVQIDVNGHTLASADFSESRSDKGFQRVEKMRSLNGNLTPLQSVEERVVKSEGGVRVVERIVKKYDPNGNAASTERTEIEERKLADGGVRSVATSYYTDVNGQYHLGERRTSENHPSGGGFTEATTVEKPTLDGALDTVERKSVTSRPAGAGKTEQDQSTYRKGQDGRFYQALRQVSETVQQNGRTTESTAQYELDYRGQMQLASQTVRNITKAADGSETMQVDIFSRVTPGHAIETGPVKSQLQEQQLIERKPAKDGGVVESLSVRRPLTNDPTQFGAYQKVSETVCSGACK